MIDVLLTLGLAGVLGWLGYHCYVPATLPKQESDDDRYTVQCNWDVNQGSILTRVTCTHDQVLTVETELGLEVVPTIVPFILIDHKAGPGSFADNFHGTVCRVCGSILEVRKEGEE